MARNLQVLQIFQGFGPAYGGDEFVRLKEIPPAVVAARTSGRCFPLKLYLIFFYI